MSETKKVPDDSADSSNITPQEPAVPSKAHVVVGKAKTHFSKIPTWAQRASVFFLVAIVGLVGMHILGFGFAATYSHNPLGNADYCLLDGNTTVIYGWAHDPDATAGSYPNVKLTVGTTTQTIPSNVAGYHDSDINSFVTKQYPGMPTSSIYGWTARYSGLYKGTSNKISGTLVNYGTGADVSMHINTTQVSYGNNTYFKNGSIPDACMPANPKPVPPPVVGLDESGATIPDTSYAVPTTNVIYIAPTGSDSADGSAATPLATVNAAISKVAAGGTIVARAGTYREGSISTNKTFTLQPYPHEQVWFDGTVVVGSGWASDGAGHWYIKWDTPSFCGGKYYTMPYNNQTTPTCSWGSPGGKKGDYGIAGHEAATDPQLVFINGKYVNEVTSLAAVTSGSNNFWYDQMNTHRIYIAQDPSSASVEIAKYPNFLMVQGGSGGNIIRGIGVRHYATDNYAPNTTRGAILAGVPKFTIENSVFTGMAGDGVAIINPTGAVVRSSVFAYNGFDGLESAGHSISGSYGTLPDNILIENNVFNMGNNEGYGCGYSCGIANVKFNHMNGATIRNNIFENGQNAAKGLWLDENSNHATVVGNVMRNNQSNGMFYEVGDSGIVASNLIVNNGGGFRMSAANVKVYNNTIFGNASGTIIYDDNRTPNGTTYGPNTANNEFVNNIMSSTGGADACARVAIFDACNGGGQTNAPSYFTAGNLDYNVYVHIGVPANLALWQTSSSSTATYATLPLFQAATGKEPNGKEITTSTAPLFVDAANGSYALATGSVAQGSGRALPADVAAAIGVTAGQAVDRGALRYWPGGGVATN